MHFGNLFKYLAALVVLVLCGEAAQTISPGERYCRSVGRALDRWELIEAVDNICSSDISLPTGASKISSSEYEAPTHYDRIILSVTKHSTTDATIDSYECGQQFRRIIDECNTSSEDNKRGGMLRTPDFEYEIITIDEKCVR